MKRALSFFLTCILLLGLLPASALAADPPAEQFPILTPGGIYWFDLSGEGIPGTPNRDIPDPTFHWVPFTYAGTINAYVLTGRSSTDEEAEKDSQTAAAIDSPNPIGYTYDHSLFVGDYNVARYVSWNALNEKNLIFGKSYTSDGVEYTMRAPSVGSYTSDINNITKVTPQNNEWNTILNRSGEYIKNSDNMYSWGQDTTAYWSERAGQGRQAPTMPPAWFRAKADYSVGNLGYRPILELKYTSARPDEMKIVRLDLNGGKAGTTSAAQDGTIQIVVRDAIGSKNFTAPSSEGLSPPQWRVFKNWKGSNNTVYNPGDSVPTSVTSLTAQWKTPLSITEQPRAAFSPEGQTASFAVAAVSDLPITYQWQVNRGSQWENISGAVTSGYTTGPVGIAMNGWKYRCVVSSGSETKTSDAAMLTLEQYPVLDPGETYWFDLSKASVPGTALESSPDPTLHWVPFTYTGTVNAYKLTSEQGTTEEYAEENRYDHSLLIADYPVTRVYRSSLDYSYGTIFGRTYISSGVAYTMRLPSAGSNSTGYGDSMCGTPQSNEWDMILNKSDEYIKNWGDTYSWGQDKHTQYNTYALRGGPHLRYWIDSAIRPGSTDTRPYSYRPVLELPASDTLASGLQVVTLDLNGGRIGSTTEPVNIVVKSGESFTAPGGEGLTVPDGKLKFSSWKDSSGAVYQAGGNVPASVTALTACWAVAPSVTVQPENKTVSAGQTAEFTVQASGEPAPTYQWQVSKDSGSSWEDIPGATSSSCTTEAATAGMNGWQYRCVVSNSQGNATSDAATLTVNAPYQIAFTGGRADGPTQITLTAATVTPSGGTVTYAKNTANEAPADGWQTGLVFSGLTAGTTYYFFAKAAASGNYLETVSPGVAIATPARSVSGIQIATQPASLTYTSGQALDLSGLSVTVTYNDGTSETIDWGSGNLTADPAQGTALTASEHNGKGVAISFGGKTANTNALTVTQGTQPPTKYLVTVNGGTGGGNYAEGAAVTITATAPSGQRFTGWTVNAGGVTLADPTSAATSFTMPAQAVTVTANFKSDSGGSSGGGGGGSSTPPTYPPDVKQPSGSGGTVSVTPSRPKPGDTVTVKPKPDEGYQVKDIDVTDRNGKKVNVSEGGGGNYTFTQPSGKVIIEIEFEPVPLTDQPWIDPFIDVLEGDWFYGAVRFAHQNGIMNGTSANTFVPGQPLTRAQLAQILFNKEDRPVVDYLMTFSDVDGGAWYGEAVRWAASQGIVSGYGDGRFDPAAPIIREQLAVMLWRYSGSPAATEKELRFSDADEISGFALEAMRWAVESGILNGYGDGRLGPQEQTTRAQAAQVLKNFFEK